MLGTEWSDSIVRYIQDLSDRKLRMTLMSGVVFHSQWGDLKGPGCEDDFVGYAQL